MAICLPTFQILGKFALKTYRRYGYNFTRVAVIGSGPTAQRLTANMDCDPGFGFRILAYFDDNANKDYKPDMTLPLDRLESFVRENDIRQIYFTLSGQHKALSKVIKIADDNCIDFYYVPQIPHTLTRGFELHNIGSLPVMAIRRNPLKNIINRSIKRAFDIVVSSAFLCVYPLIYIPIAIAIKTGPRDPYISSKNAPDISEGHSNASSSAQCASMPRPIRARQQQTTLARPASAISCAGHRSTNFLSS